MRAIDNTHSSFPNLRYNVIMAEHLTDHSQLLWETYARLGIKAPSTAREFPCPFTVPVTSQTEPDHTTADGTPALPRAARFTHPPVLVFPLHSPRRWHERYPPYFRSL